MNSELAGSCRYRDQAEYGRKILLSWCLLDERVAAQTPSRPRQISIDLPQHGHSMFKHRILHIENDDDFRILLDRALRRAGLDIDFHVVDDADAFERALTEGAIDLVLSDWNVPGFSAQAALLSLRQRDPSTPFIILSGAPKEADPSLAAGAAAWLDKGDLEGAAQALSRFLSPQPPTVDGSPATTPGADHPSVRVD